MSKHHGNLQVADGSVVVTNMRTTPFETDVAGILAKASTGPCLTL